MRPGIFQLLIAGLRVSAVEKPGLLRRERRGAVPEQDRGRDARPAEDVSRAGLEA